MSVVRHVSPEEVNRAIAAVEDRYPDFAAIYDADDLDGCCKLDEVADRYGWGPATDVWDAYAAYRFLRGDR